MHGDHERGATLGGKIKGRGGGGWKRQQEKEEEVAKEVERRRI